MAERTCECDEAQATTRCREYISHQPVRHRGKLAGGQIVAGSKSKAAISTMTPSGRKLRDRRGEESKGVLREGLVSKYKGVVNEPYIVRNRQT